MIDTPFWAKSRGGIQSISLEQVCWLVDPFAQLKDDGSVRVMKTRGKRVTKSQTTRYETTVMASIEIVRKAPLKTFREHWLWDRDFRATGIPTSLPPPEPERNLGGKLLGWMVKNQRIVMVNFLLRTRTFRTTPPINSCFV